MYRFRMFYIEPPITRTKLAEKIEFITESFEDAISHSKKWIEENTKEGTEIFMIARIDRLPLDLEKMKEK